MEDVKEMIRILSSVDTILGGWRDTEMVSAIERDIVLSRIRELYEKVLVCGLHRDGGSVKAAGCAAADVPEASASVQAACVVAPDAPQVSACPADEPQSMVAQPVEAPVELSSAAAVAEESGRTAAFGECDDPTVAPAPETAVHDENGEEAREDAAADAEARSLRSKVDREFLMSLYCERAVLDPQPKSQEPVQQPAPTVPQIEEPVAAEQPERMAAGVEFHATRVIGDVLGSQERTVADALGGDKMDVASRIVASQSTGLRRSIGVNDRFLFIRDLFGGDAAAYDAAIERLERFDDLNDAMLYIYENYSWNPDSDAVKLMVELLTRKLS